MNLSAGVTAGPGVYFAEDFLSSASYQGNEKGNLIEVVVKKGTPWIDLADPAISKKMYEMKIDLYDVYDRANELNLPVALRYYGNDGWWVMKGKEGIEFRPFDYKSMPAMEKNKLYLELLKENYSPHGVNAHALTFVLGASGSGPEIYQFDEKRQRVIEDLVRLMRGSTYGKKYKNGEEVLASLKSVGQESLLNDPVIRWGVFRHFNDGDQSERKTIRKNLVG